MANSIFQIKKIRDSEPIFAFKEGDNANKNAIASDIVRRLNSSVPGQYQQILTQIQNKYGENVLKNILSKEDINQINSFYIQKNISTKWNANQLGAKPPTGEFDSAYYKEQVPEVAEKWKQANEGFSFAGTKMPNLDITERYGDENTYLHYDYTSQGKQKNVRANAAELAADAEYYTETQKPITDAEKQAYRDQINGLFESGDIQEGLQKLVDIEQEERFNVMRNDVLKKTIAKLNAAKKQEDELGFFKNMPGISEIYDFGSTVSNELLGDSGLGGYLSMVGQKGLKENIENMFSTGNSTVYNWQKWFDEELAEKYNPLYPEYIEESKNIDEKQKIIEAYTKRNNNINPEIYISGNEKKLVFNTATNRFDEDFLDEIGFNTTKELENFLSKNENDKKLLSLLKENPLNKYSNTDSMVIDLLNEINEEQKKLKSQLSELYSPPKSTTIKTNDKEYEIAKEEVQAFINDYLKPRFDYSRSMDEFVSYLDVSNNQQNVLQTQTLSNKIKELTKIQTDSYLDRLQEGNKIIGIDTDYYFNTDGKHKKDQIFIVNLDWEKAKKNPNTTYLQRQGQGERKNWAEWAYQYGLDLNNKDDFAKLHYELKGKTLGYDPRKDYVDQKQVVNYVSESILPYVTQEAGKVKNVFLDFVPPEEYLNTLSDDYDFLENENIKELLEENDIDSDLYDPEEINNMFAEVLRTVPAENIRKQIEELNKKKKKPTQELLGVSYIEREEDVKEKEEESKDAIYDIFKQAGFEGDKDEFKDFIGEDLSVEGMDLISEFGNLDFSDPMKSLSKLQSLSSFEQDDAESEYNKIFGEAEKKDMDFMSSFTGDAFGMGSFFF